ncbi:MAG: OmpA family protein, partial [Bacteroidota bacterium]
TDRNYAFNVSKEGYLFFSENFSLVGLDDPSEPFIMDIPLQPLSNGISIELKNIFYETDKYDLKPESRAELNKVIEFLNSNPDVKIEIGGHTDNVGTKEYNQVLSENRAKTVSNYLTNHGIAKNRVQHKGYNFSQPKYPNDTEGGRAKNRRTELKIISIK